MTKRTRRQKRETETTQLDAPDAQLDAPRAHVEFEWVQWRQLRPWAGNPKTYDAQEIAEICASVERWGWGRPVQANRHPGLEGQIIAGHRALLAAEHLGDDFQARNSPGPGLVPVRWMRLPAKEAHALALADNQHTKKELDAELMRALVRTDELDPLDWMTAGFEEREIRAFTFDAWPEQQGGGGAQVEHQFSVIIDCASEEEQVRILAWCEENQLKCRALI